MKTISERRRKKVHSPAWLALRFAEYLSATTINKMLANQVPFVCSTE